MISASKAQTSDFSLFHLMKYKVLRKKGFLLLEMRSDYRIGKIETRKGPTPENVDPFLIRCKPKATNLNKACIPHKMRATAALRTQA